jgi:hypothetical protein
MPLRAPRFITSARLQKASLNQPALTIGETNDGVARLQQALIDLGWPMPRSTGNGFRGPDGMFGGETHAALKSWQAGMSLSADGVAGKLTLTRLDETFLRDDPWFGNRLAERMACLRDTGPDATRSLYGASTARHGRA